MAPYICTMHKMHCSSACLLKVYCGAGRGAMQITSAGDIPLKGSRSFDEEIFPPQRRACPRGYAEIDHLNSPYRLTQPLLQTGSRGCRSTFRPISWNEAIGRTAEFYHAMQRESEKLGYLPILEKAGVGSYLGTTLSTFGNSSSGCADGAIYAALGDKQLVRGHPPIDLFNTNYLVIWANNPAETLPYLSFLLVKARERGIPVTVVDSRYTDSAATYATGWGDAPAFINPRPGTDGALLAAMAYVIYKNNLHDEDFIRNYCFGFYPGEEVVSRSCGKDPVTGKPYFGNVYRVPAGESFLEYLLSLEKDHGGYQGVLQWCEKTTGVPAYAAEQFALAYGRAKPAFLFSRYNGGAQRSYNGVYYCWMLIALSAMTGNLTKRGGGFGELRGEDRARYSYPQEPALFSVPPRKPILVGQYTSDRVILTGLDGRSPAQLRADVLAMNGIDLGRDARLSLHGIVKGARNGDPFNQTPNINMHRLAWDKLRFVMTYEREFSPMAAMCDIVLPSAGLFESPDSLQQHNFGGSDTYLLRQIFSPVGQAKTDREIQRLLGQALGLQPKSEEEYAQLARFQWEKAKVPEETMQYHPEYRKPSYRELVEKGSAPLPFTPQDTEPDAARFRPGEFPTETGRINFYSPFVAMRGRASHGVARACYVPLEEGFEQIGTVGVLGAKGIRYPLQLVAPHTISKADATFDNVPSLRRLRPNYIHIHPDDAAKRGLSEGNTAYLFNDIGCLRLPVHLTATLPRGVVAVPHGPWYFPDEADRFEAWFDTDGDGIPEPHDTAVDQGGSTNTVTPQKNSGWVDPFIVGMGLNSNGHACEVSPHNPDEGRGV